MSKVIHLRVLLDYEEDVFRDIELDETETFAALHAMIQEAFGFDNSQMASFYESNDEWEKGQEITLMEVMEPSETGAPIWLMHDITLDRLIFAKGQKFVYVFDFMLMWCFFIEVISVKPKDPKTILPRISNSYGLAPNQYDKSDELMFESEERLMPDEMEEDLEGEDMDELEDMFRLLGNEEDGDEREH